MPKIAEFVEQEINRSTRKYGAAVESLKQATSEAKRAKRDVEKVAGTISKITSAINKVEKVIIMGIRLMS